MAPALGMAGADAVGVAGDAAGVDAAVGTITADSQVDAALTEHVDSTAHAAVMASAERPEVSVVAPSTAAEASTATAADPSMVVAAAVSTVAVVEADSTAVAVDTAVADTGKSRS